MGRPAAPLSPGIRPAVAIPSIGRAVRPIAHRLGEWAIQVMAVSAILAIVLIFIFLARETLPLFTSDEIRQEVTTRKMWLAQLWPSYDRPEYIWQPVSNVPKYAILPLLAGTLKVTAVAMVIAVPLAIGAAIFVSQYASRRVREILKPVVELLAGIPSVVLGFFALIVLASWLQNLLGLESRLSAFLAGVALSLAVIPIIFTVCEDALGAVPRSYVEASTALGARRWQTILFVLLPSASPGLAAAIALGFGRAVGETMIVLMASGNASILSLSVTDSARTLSATIAAELAEVVFGGAHYTVLFYLGGLLFVMTFVINLIGSLATARLRAKMGGQA